MWLKEWKTVQKMDGLLTSWHAGLLNYHFILIWVLVLWCAVLVLPSHSPRSSFPKEFTAQSGGSGQLWWWAAVHRPNRTQRSATVQHWISLGAGPQDFTPAQVGKCNLPLCTSYFHSDVDEWETCQQFSLRPSSDKIRHCSLSWADVVYLCLTVSSDSFI